MKNLTIKLLFVAIVSAALFYDIYINIRIANDVEAIADSSLFICGLQVNDDGSLYRRSEDD